MFYLISLKHYCYIFNYLQMSSSDDEELFEVSEEEEMVNEQRAIENSFEITQTTSA